LTDIDADYDALHRTPHLIEDDFGHSAVRPSLMADFIGQAEVMKNLAVYLEATKIRGIAIDHTLLSGPPGLGKTTIAQIIAHETGGTIQTIIGPAIQRAGDIASILATIRAGDVLFIDEIHRIPPSISEMLYSAMEDFRLDLVIGEGASCRAMQIDLPRFTLVGATTRAGALPSPLLNRFGIHLTLTLYDVEDLIAIIERSARVQGTHITTDAAYELASRSRGTPRIANRLLRRVHDFSLVAGMTEITREIADRALTQMGVDIQGLDALDRRYLDYIRDNYAGGPVGIDTIAAGLSESRDTLEDQVEPFLMRAGYIVRTSRGRMLKPAALTPSENCGQI
jgi:Holliday junction DNA helicase RuvB